MKHDHTQTAVAHDWLNQSSWNKYGHAAKVTTNATIYINEVLHYQFVHRKISTLTFGTSDVHDRLRKFHDRSINIDTVAIGLNLLGLCDRYSQDTEPAKPQRIVQCVCLCVETFNWMFISSAD